LNLNLINFKDEFKANQIIIIFFTKNLLFDLKLIIIPNYACTSSSRYYKQTFTF